MSDFESLLVLLTAAVVLAAAARRVDVPYPAFLAVGGALLALLPHAPTFDLQPELALALFVAPVLLDAAYDASLRDLRENWVPLTALVVGAVGVTTLAAACVARVLVPDIPWSAAVALGAVVAPPDAAAATAVLRQLRPPHRIMTILEGESLLNDATALFIYRTAVTAALAQQFDFVHSAPGFLFGIAGSVVAGPVFARTYLALTRRITDIPTAVILQFVSTFGVWIVAERLGFSAVLTMVCYAFTIARHAPEWLPARMRVPSYAVWETAVFVLNVLAFVFIGLQIRPILGALEPGIRQRYLIVSLAILGTIIAVRVIWVAAYAVIVGAVDKTPDDDDCSPKLTPTLGGSAVVAWCGMRGIVTLAAALALPHGAEGSFPYRDLIVLTAFCVVLGTLLIQGLTLKPLLVAVNIRADDVVGREVALARTRAIQAAVDSLGTDRTAPAMSVREELQERLTSVRRGTRAARTPHDRLRRNAVAAGRRTLLRLRETDTIGDDAFHIVEEELDWLEMSGTTIEP